jgi:GNAT superfamily N-acetyltransferase
MSELSINTWEGYANESGIEPIAELEKECWSPWLAASLGSLKGRAEVFPNGQLCIYSELGLLGTLSVNEIQWDGQPSSLPTWDQVAGEPTTYEHTYVPNGNTLCLMSMNVSPLGRGQQLPKLLIATLLDFAKNKGIEHVIGSFRPSAYSQAVLTAVKQGQEPPVFETYCQTVNEHGEPVDPWLRSLSKNGMKPLAVDHHAMQIPISQEEFASVQKPDWQQITIAGQPVWWCAETGFFCPQADGSYVYSESNIWGALYEKQ